MFTWSRGYVPGAHLGVDLAAATGTPVLALEDGVVTYAGDTRTDAAAPSWSSWQGRRGAAGIACAIEQLGRTVLYVHLSRLLVTRGQRVAKGQRIGLVGATGYAFGSHLHLGVIASGSFVDPLSIWSRSFLLDTENGSSSGAGEPLTFWGVVTFPRGHVLTIADVDTIMSKLRDAGYFRDDLTGVAQVGLRSLLTALVGRTWDDQLALDIARGLGIGADQVKGAAGGDLVAGIGQAIAGALGGFAWLAAILVLIILGLYVTLSPGGSST